MGSKDSKGKEKEEDLTAFHCLVEVAMADWEKMEKERLMKETMSQKEKEGLKIDNAVNNSPDFSEKSVVIFKGKKTIEEKRVNLKRCFEPGEISGVNNMKLKKQKKYCMDSFGQPGLPKRLKKMIKGIGGTDEKLIIQKPLTKTDLNKHHCRLAIPMNQVKVEFLTDEEKNELNEKKSKGIVRSRSDLKGIGTLVIEPSLETREMIFKIWDMKKPSGKTCSIYVLSSDWNSVVKGNDLKVNDVIQLWSFRAKSILCFGLVIVRSVGRRKMKLQSANA